jgi:uncharacterized membrane-anchored protein
VRNPFRRATDTDKSLVHTATKVPEIFAIFWVLKLLTTGMGEAMSDFMGQKSVPVAAFIGIFGLWIALRLQLRQAEYRAPYYWFAVMMVAVFGTMAADGIHDGTGIGYAVTTPLFALVTAGIFYLWYRSEGTLSIHSITTRRRERYYWAAVLATFALGTAAGDLTALALNLGFFASIWLFAAIISVPAIAWWRFNLNPIVAFWLAYVSLWCALSGWSPMSPSPRSTSRGRRVLPISRTGCRGWLPSPTEPSVPPGGNIGA